MYFVLLKSSFSFFLDLWRNLNIKLKNKIVPLLLKPNSGKVYTVFIPFFLKGDLEERLLITTQM